MKKSLCTLALTLMCIALLPAQALAALPATEFDDGRVIEFSPGSSYTQTDMFSEFKNVMPGDTISEDILVRDDCDDCEYIKVYLRALAHDSVSRQLSSGVAAAGENVASMSDFLSKLTLTVYDGDVQIYRSHPDLPGGLNENVYLGTIRKNEHLDLRVVLEVPLELDERYMDREGEVDWVFVAEEYDGTETDPTPTPASSPAPTAKPYYKPALIQTGQLWWPAALLGAVGAVMLLLGLNIRRRNGGS